MRSVLVGTTAAFALAVACIGVVDLTNDDEQTMQDAEYTEICQDANGNRASDSDCEDPDHHHGSHFIYIPLSSGYHPPPVGSHIDPTRGTTIRPAGYTVARAPLTGGFGRTATAGS